MIKAHSVGGAGAAIVAGDEIAIVAQLLHDLDHVLSHGAERIVDVVGTGFRQRAVAVASQIGQHDVIVLRQSRSHLVPADMVLRISVQQQQRRSRAAVTQTDHGSAGTHVEMVESRKHRGDLGAAPAGGIARVIRSGGHRQYRGMLVQFTMLDHVAPLWLRLMMIAPVDAHWRATVDEDGHDFFTVAP